MLENIKNPINKRYESLTIEDIFQSSYISFDNLLQTNSKEEHNLTRLNKTKTKLNLSKNICLKSLFVK
ncbi:hypothetical protein [Aliarcobacter cryaerophilus]|uniref:hypothetical protein n=1 Tax=Aliarcobacter cryaerophilus TaxID=28198 RepID=UPI00082ED452|nr:hypothetical protein [Aliarcobacter cryaerophilus]